MATRKIDQDLQAIREAVYGEEVRGAIVDGIEQAYLDANDVVKVSETQPTGENVKLWVKPESDEYKVPTWQEFSALRNGYVDFGTAKKEYYDLGNKFPTGAKIGSKVTTGTYYHYIIELDDVVEGETFYIEATDGTTARPYAILDANRIILEKPNSASFNDAITIPTGGKTLIVQVRDTNIGSAACIRNTNVYALGGAISTNETNIAAANEDIDAIIKRTRREKGNIYLGATTTIDITKSGGSLVVHMSGRLVIRLLGDNGADARDWADISANLTESQITIDGNAATITIPNYSWLVYNTTDKQLYLRTNNGSGNYKIDIDDIVLLYNAYAQPVTGILHEKWLDQGLRSTQSELSSVDDRIAVLENDVDISAELTELTALQGNDDEQTGTGPSDSFLFFTDPHLCEGNSWQSRYKSWLNKLRGYKDHLPLQFTVCGGDWLGSNDTKQGAFEKLGTIISTVRSILSPCYMCVGNHDLNEQGSVTLKNQSVANIWYGGSKNYTDFETDICHYFVLNTGVDASGAGLWFKDEERWLIAKLQANAKEHVAFFQHIIYKAGTTTRDSDEYVTGGTIQTVAQAFLDIAQAFNNRSSISIDGTSYSFANATGHVDYVLCGHNHRDGDVLINGIPVIIRTSMRYSASTPTTQQVFDMVVADYGQRIVHLLRVGERGSNKDVAMTVV